MNTNGWLFFGGLLAVGCLAQTKKGREQLIGIFASALISTTVQAMISANQRQLG
jgi:hypothetical protein